MITIFTDGGARGNPGPAALGYVIYDENGNVKKSSGEYLGRQTNNYAEYMALIRALEAAVEIERGGEVEVRMDSELIVRQMKGEYKIKQPHLRLLARQVFDLRKKFNSVKFTHVPREKNKEADRMVNEALDNQTKTL